VPYLDNYWSNSFSPKCDPLVFGVFHLPKYFGNLSNFISHAIPKFPKTSVIDCGNTTCGWKFSQNGDPLNVAEWDGEGENLSVTVFNCSDKSTMFAELLFGTLTVTCGYGPLQAQQTSVNQDGAGMTGWSVRWLQGQYLGLRVEVKLMTRQELPYMYNLLGTVYAGIYKWCDIIRKMCSLHILKDHV
jgi:hypothetical protein